jgi:hypothetical protein
VIDDRSLRNPPRFPFGVAAVLLLVALATRAWTFGNPVYHVDEQYYLLVGERMLHGAVPYVDLWDRKPIGLFLIFAAIRMLPGDGVLAEQLVATGFAVATAGLVVAGARRLGASAAAALAAGATYLVWLPLLSGAGGQSPVFYNLFMAAGGVLVLRLPALADRRDRRAIVASGAAACLLAGLAIQTKYTPLVEGGFFGLAHLIFLRRAGARWGAVALAGGVWASLGLLPTVAAIIAFAAMGRAVFDAFWFANFASVALRHGYPAAKIAARLAGTSAQLLPLVACAVATARRRSPSTEVLLALGWLAAALVGYLMIGAFFDHYALPLIAPLAMLAAPTFTRHARAGVATLAIGAAIFLVKATTRPDEGPGIRALARVVAANDGGRCPYVFAGDSAVYLLAHACVPTARAFPSTLAYAAESGASGVDPVAEVRRILAGCPPVIVTLDRPLGSWNEATHDLIAAALARDYRLAFSAPREDGHELVYVRKEQP